MNIVSRIEDGKQISRLCFYLPEEYLLQSIRIRKFHRGFVGLLMKS